jgi:hypothetical protein
LNLRWKNLDRQSKAECSGNSSVRKLIREGGTYLGHTSCIGRLSSPKEIVLVMVVPLPPLVRVPMLTALKLSSRSVPLRSGYRRVHSVGARSYGYLTRRMSNTPISGTSVKSPLVSRTSFRMNPLKIGPLQSSEQGKANTIFHVKGPSVASDGYSVCMSGSNIHAAISSGIYFEGGRGKVACRPL